MPRPDPHPRRSPIVQALSPLRDFLHTEAAGGTLLVTAAVAALVWANSPWNGTYGEFWGSHIDITVAGHTLALDVRHWINDGLMAIFFLVVGLEIKRELTSGNLAGRRAAMLPIAAAAGGMIVPAVIYLAIAGASEPRGWGVPMATDIALAVGVLASLGDRVPSSLRAFLLGLAIVDDIGAIIVIAVAYSSGVSWPWLAIALGATLAVVPMRRANIQSPSAYVVPGVLAWFALHEAGIHPTLAGVAMGLLAPSTPRLSPEFIDAEQLTELSTAEDARVTSELARASVSTVEWLQHTLHPWTSYLIVPVFALANAGIEISTPALDEALRSPLAWGVLAGLVLGKPVGVVIAAMAATRAQLAVLPEGTSRRQLVGIGQAAGIGFTVALFIAELAFRDPPDQDAAKLAILVASFASAVLAVTVLRTGRHREHPIPRSPERSLSGDR